MNCPKCGKQVQSGAAFCMYCGAALSSGQPVSQPQVPRPTPFPPGSAPFVPVAAGAPPSNLSAAFEQQKRRNLILAVALTCIAAICAGAFALRSMGVIGAGGDKPDDPSLYAHGKTPADSSLVAMAKTPPGPLQAVGSTTPTPLEAAGKAPLDMPDDIYKWLEHLRISEEKRTEITISHLTTAYTEKEKSQLEGGVDALKDLLNGIDDPNSEIHSPTEKLANVLKKMHDDVHEVLVFFDSMEPPQECIPIRDAYDQALNEEAAQMGDIADHLASGDIEKLLKMEGKSAAGIDSAGAKTDRLVGEICDKYNKRRWFSISSDIKSTSIFGSGF